jgi:hypothetical protein
MSSLLARADHLTTAVAVEDTQAIQIDREDIAALLRRKPLAGLDMMTMIEKQLRATHELMRARVSRNPNTEIEATETWGDRCADAVARFGGSWRFVISFGVILTLYVVVNVVLATPWNPLPVHPAELVPVDARRGASAGHHDESEPAGRERSRAERARLSREPQSGSRDHGASAPLDPRGTAPDRPPAADELRASPLVTATIAAAACCRKGLHEGFAGGR